MDNKIKITSYALPNTMTSNLTVDQNQRPDLLPGPLTKTAIKLG